jgi:hypothetical protein
MRGVTTGISVEEGDGEGVSDMLHARMAYVSLICMYLFLPVKHIANALTRV